MRTCITQGCERVHYAKGLCKPEYKSAVRSVFTMPDHLDGSTLDRYMDRVDIDIDTLCWNWVGGKDRDGYSTFDIGETKVRAYRVAYIVLVGDVGTHQLHHLCGNKVCVNPDHLQPMSLGDHQSLHYPKGRKFGDPPLVP